MAKSPQELHWIEDLLPEDQYRRKSMFGGFAYYMDDRLFMVTFESKGQKKYKGQNFDYELWEGCMFPVEKEHHPEVLQKFPFLIVHPILGKWLYVPTDTEGFEELVTDVLKQALKPHGNWGTIKNKPSKKDVLKDKSLDKIDTRTPRMFSDEPAEDRMAKAKKISDLRNLGPTAEARFHKAGIKTPQQFNKLGWKKTLEKMVKIDRKTLHTMWAYTLIGALTNRDWNILTEAEKQESKEFVKALKKSLDKKAPAAKKKVTKKVAKKTKKKTVSKRR